MASLYLHIPFCEHKCIYCDFYSIENLDPMERFVSALEQEISMYRSYSGHEIFDTIFFGGGTPSLLSPRNIHDILEHLYKTFRVIQGAEITLETNPGTVDRNKLKEFYDAGVNRLSIGIQSFHDDDLRFLTRIHSSNDARQTVRIAREVGFENINIDLMFSLPDQTLQRWNENLRQAVDLRPQHISAYSLIVEQGTPLARMVRAQQVSPLPVETDAELYEFTMEYLASEGYRQYEVSNYAREGYECRHNVAYWSHAPYLGFGPSAHSFWSKKRWWNIANVSSYCETILRGKMPVAGEETLRNDQLLDEIIMLGLRSRGVNLQELKERLGVDLMRARRLKIDQLINEKLATLETTTLRLTSKGMLICDEISQLLLASASAA